MTIRTVEAAIAELDNVTLVTSYGGNVTRRQHIFVAIADENGVTGFGEGSPLPHFSGERAPEMLNIIRQVFAPVLVGIDPFDIESAWQRIDSALPHHHASKAALVNALYDLQGKHVGLPAGVFLGGRLRDNIPLGRGVGIGDDASVIACSEHLWSKGARTLKFKIGTDSERDIRIIRAVRDTLPPELEIRADANAGYSFSQAQRFLRGVAECRLQYLEQPLHPDDWRGLAKLRQYGTPIAVDESLFSLRDALGLIQAEAADVMIIKIIKLGGMHQARKVVALAEAAGITCVAVSPYESALGAAANLHLAASSSAFPFAAELAAGPSAVTLEGGSYIETDGNSALVPKKEGIGISLPNTLFDTAIHAAAGA